MKSGKQVAKRGSTNYTKNSCKKKKGRAGGVAQLVERLPSKCENLSSNHSSSKKKEEKNDEEGRGL
jgi:hypothetical protein